MHELSTLSFSTYLRLIMCERAGTELPSLHCTKTSELKGYSLMGEVFESAKTLLESRGGKSAAAKSRTIEVTGDV